MIGMCGSIGCEVFMLKGIVKFLLILNSNQRAWQIAGAVAFGLLLAMVPAANLLWVLLFVLLLVIKVNKAVALLFMVIFRLFAPLYDPLTESLGFAVLSVSGLEGFFSFLYNTPLLPFFAFNNSLVMGGFLCGLVLFAPMVLIVSLLVGLYRKKVSPLWKNSKFYKKLAAVPWIKKISDFFSKVSSSMDLKKGIGA